MLESAVGDGSEKLRLQQEIAKASGMNADIAALFIGIASRHRQVSLFYGSVGGRWSCCCVIRLKFFVGVVDKVLFGMRHTGSGVKLRLRTEMLEVGPSRFDLLLRKAARLVSEVLLESSSPKEGQITSLVRFCLIWKEKMRGERLFGMMGERVNELVDEE